MPARYRILAHGGEPDRDFGSLAELAAAAIALRAGRQAKVREAFAAWPHVDNPDGSPGSAAVLRLDLFERGAETPAASRFLLVAGESPAELIAALKAARPAPVPMEAA